MMIGSLLGGVLVATISALFALIMGSGLFFAVLAYALGGMAGMVLLLGFAFVQNRAPQSQPLALNA